MPERWLEQMADCYDRQTDKQVDWKNDILIKKYIYRENEWQIAKTTDG